MAKFFVNKEISEAHTISKDFYLDKSVFEQSKERIFTPSWQFAGDASEISYPGDVVPLNLFPDFIDEPLFLLNDAGEIRCFPNVCTHRGMLLVTEPKQKLRNITCKYHGRCFHLNGNLKTMPGFEGVKNFPSEADHLKNIEVNRWGNLLFVRLTGTHQFKDIFGAIMQQMEWFPMEKLVFHPEFSRTFEPAAHWALYCENYLEGFHIPFVHSGLNSVIDFASYSTVVHDYSNVQIALAKEGEIHFELPENHFYYGKKVAAFYYWVYPNMMFNFYPWGLSLNVVEPVGIEKTRVRFLTYISDASKFDRGAGSELDKVEMEDEWVVQMVQKGIKSRFYSHGRYSVKYESGTHHFHRLLSKSLND